jgi:hypothetical protein
MESIKQDPNTQTDTTNLIYLVHAADVLSKHLVEGKPDLAASAEIDPAVRAELKIGPEGWERFQLRTEEEIGKARAFLEML